MYKIKSDKYKTVRGGQSRLLDVMCGHCGQHVSYYQKDGPGILKRMYCDRMIGSKTESKELSCEKCGRVLGVKIIYEKENRPAYRLILGAVTKKIVKKETAKFS